MSDTKVTVETNNDATAPKALDQRINTYMHGALSIVFLGFMGAAMLTRITDFKTFMVGGMVVGGWVPLHYIVQIISAVYGARLLGGPTKGPMMPPPPTAMLMLAIAKVMGGQVADVTSRVATTGIAAMVASSVAVASCSGFIDAHRRDPIAAIQNIDMPLVRAAVDAARTFASIAGLSGDARAEMDSVLGHVERSAALVSSGAGVAGSPNAANTVNALRDLKALLEGFGVRTGQRANVDAIRAHNDALLRVRAALGERQ